GDPDRVRARAQEGDSAVDAAAHCDGHASRIGCRAEHRPERVRERVHRELGAADSRRLEQRQALERPLEPLRLGARDPVTVEREPNERPAAVTRRIAYDLEHAARLARRVVAATTKRTGEPRSPRSNSSLPMFRARCEPGLARWVPRRLRRSAPRVERRLPLHRCWFYIEDPATHRLEQSSL